MVDIYSKIVLTIIAAALSVIAYGQMRTSPAMAMGGCGDASYNACHVVVDNGSITVDGTVIVDDRFPLSVRVMP